MRVNPSFGALDELLNPTTKALLDSIGSLRPFGIRQVDNLPRIVVAGGQSAGKSSVLQRISGFEFPVQNVCPRFTVVVDFVRATEPHVHVKILSDDESLASHDFDRTSFSKDDLPDIIQEAEMIMCVGTQAGPVISKDVLFLRIQGPDVYPLTLIDLPGFPHGPEATQPEAERKIANDLAAGYMGNSNTFILAIVSADERVAGQNVLDKARQHDPRGERTLGIITKPDLAQTELGDEQTFIRIAKGQEPGFNLPLGWHVLRNEDILKETTLGVNEEEKKFFDDGLWSSIFPGNRGISSLKQRLSRAFLHQVQQNIPTIIKDIEFDIGELQVELDHLGKSRITLEDRKSYLLRIAEDFQRLARAGVEGRYSDPFFGNLADGEQKLRAQLRNFNRAFVFTMSTRGAKQRIFSTASDLDDEDETSHDFPPSSLEAFLDKHPYDFDLPSVISDVQMNEDIAEIASVNQGREFPGAPNSELAIQLFVRQSEPWKAITEFHIEQVMTAVKLFVDQVFIHLTGAPEPNSTTDAILRTIVDPFFEKIEATLRLQLKHLLRPYSEGYGIPAATDFYSKYSENSIGRLANQLVSSLNRHGQNPGASTSKGGATLDKMMIAAEVAEEHFGCNEFGTERVLDMMQAYYNVSPNPSSGRPCLTSADVSENLHRERHQPRHRELSRPRNTDHFDTQGCGQHEQGEAFRAHFRVPGGRGKETSPPARCGCLKRSIGALQEAQAQTHNEYVGRTQNPGGLHVDLHHSPLKQVHSPRCCCVDHIQRWEYQSPTSLLISFWLM